VRVDSPFQPRPGARTSAGSTVCDGSGFRFIARSLAPLRRGQYQHNARSFGAVPRNPNRASSRHPNRCRLAVSLLSRPVSGGPHLFEFWGPRPDRSIRRSAFSGDRSPLRSAPTGPTARCDSGGGHPRCSCPWSLRQTPPPTSRTPLDASPRRNDRSGWTDCCGCCAGETGPAGPGVPRFASGRHGESVQAVLHDRHPELVAGSPTPGPPPNVRRSGHFSKTGHGHRTRIPR